MARFGPPRARQGDHLIGESSGAGVAQKTYVYEDGTPVAQLDHGSSLTVTYLHTDQLGTPRAGRDGAGNVVWRWDSDAFGTTASNEDPDGNLQARIINLRFPGQYKDAETALHYNHYRYYAAGLGRYLQSDPIGIAGGINTYAYALNNPLSKADPTGLESSAGPPICNGVDCPNPSPLPEPPDPRSPRAPPDAGRYDICKDLPIRDRLSRPSEATIDALKQG